jgi:hypothetical protein
MMRGYGAKIGTGSRVKTQIFHTREMARMSHKLSIKAVVSLITVRNSISNHLTRRITDRRTGAYSQQMEDLVPKNVNLTSFKQILKMMRVWPIASGDNSK